MARKNNDTKKKNYNNPNVLGLHAEVVEQKITDTLEVNYMPYAMSVIVSRAIPEIDGFKPSHRKLLYTMYKMGLLNGARTKSANIVGQTMKLNPHGDAAIYETMVRLAAGNEALLVPFVDSKGNFGKVYSRDMSYAASRYTEAKLSSICSEIFKDIDKDTVDLVDNYDGSMKEPLLLPTTYPNVLVSANSGIAVGMASMICGFNLNEVCNTTIKYLKNPDIDLFDTLLAPDFSTGGELIFRKDELDKVYETGKGSFKVRAKWRHIPSDNIIEIFEIPYTTTTDIIIDRIVELSKLGKLKEINDVRDETDLSGLRIAIDLKRGTDPEKLMSKLFKLTTLQDSFACNFNILVDGYPKVMGIKNILNEWCKWRVGCVRRRVEFDLNKKSEKLHLLQGLGKILIDIDKAISIIRNTELDSDVVPNLMMGFGIDEAQANYVAEIKLRNINKEYIVNRVSEINQLLKDVEELQSVLDNESKIISIIIDELKKVNEKFLIPRKTSILYDDVEEYTEEVEPVNSYHVTCFLSNDGYFKKINDQSLRMSAEQKFKENDSLKLSFEAENGNDIIVLTDKYQAYKARLSDFDDTKASVLGTYLPSALKMDPGESVLTVFKGDYSKKILIVFENGNAVKIPISSYETKLNRKKLSNAYSDKSKVINVIPLEEDTDITLYSTDNKILVFHTSLLETKKARDASGCRVFSLKKNQSVEKAITTAESKLENISRYRAKKIPSSGTMVVLEDTGVVQLSFL